MDQGLKEKLKEVFGYGTFRGNQEEIINNLLDGNNTFVIMPTGAGKSLCYQLPAVMTKGTAIVISPLIALMKNQVDQLNALGVNAKVLNSTLTKTEANRVKKEVLEGKIKLLYIAPESLSKEDYVNFLRRSDISLVAIDEAHCISEWGHDFRPEYRRIREIIAQIGDISIIALTATATPKVRQDIRKNLNMEDADVYISSFNRENLFYEVRPKIHAKKQLIQFLSERKGSAGIIYCLSRKKVQEIAEFLKVNGFKAAPYHAGLDTAVREKNQDDFLNEDIDIIVATIAFGMGIDKPDVRFVVHFDVPKSLEGYYQETGRAGRDGLRGDCMMFYSHNDLTKLEKFNKDKPVTERENARLLLQEMSFYAESTVCRRKQLLHYFGEEFKEDNCGKCDNCTKPREQFEGKDAVLLALQTVQQTNERFTLNHLANVIRGVSSQHVKSYEHDKLEVFKKGKEESEEYWKSVIRQSLLFEYLVKDVENIGVLKLSDRGVKFLKQPQQITLTKDHDYSQVRESEEEEGIGSQTSFRGGKSYDENLFELLKATRKSLAKKKNLPPYVIFQDPSLEEMATTYPTTKDELAKVNGVGMGKVTKYGQPFLDLIEKYVYDNDITTATDVVVKSSVNKSRLKISIIQQIDRQVDLDEIAESHDMKLSDLIQELEPICYSGTKLNLQYYIDQIMDDDRQDEIHDYFMEADSDSMGEAMDELGDEYSEEELRLMRIMFISEYAN
ncbi:MAG: DNA helicase RecQ [Bacteroidota bacterium]